LWGSAQLDEDDVETAAVPQKADVKASLAELWAGAKTVVSLRTFQIIIAQVSVGGNGLHLLCARVGQEKSGGSADRTKQTMLLVATQPWHGSCTLKDRFSSP
jgi:hypothetical protein